MKNILHSVRYLLVILLLAGAANAWAGATSTVLSVSPNPPYANQFTILTATVTGVNPTGTVTFFSGGTSMGTATLSAGTATLQTIFGVPGTYSGLTAVYNGDANNAASTSAAVSGTILGTATTTQLTSTPNSSTAGQAVTLTATISVVSVMSTNPIPSGVVTFYDGTQILGTASVGFSLPPIGPIFVPTPGPSATLSVTFFTGGTHSVTAVYSGDTNYSASTSAALAQTVTGTSTITTTTTALAATPNTSAAGQSVTMTATVTGANPTGAVTFMDGATPLGTGTITAGTATLSAAFRAPGAHSLTAVYAGDAKNSPSTSAAVGQTVNAATSTTTLTSGLNPSPVGMAVTLTAMVTGYSPTGTVTFMDGATTLGTGALAGGVATLSHAFTTTGLHSLTVVYAGDANNAGSTSAAVSQTVSIAPTATALTIMSANTSPTVGLPIVLAATVTGYNPTGTVTFMEGATTLGTATVAYGAASMFYTFTTGGTHTVTAVYGGDANNAASTSAAVSQTVNVVTLISGTAPASLFIGRAVTLYATVNVAGGNATGSVSFMDGNTLLGSVPLAPTLGFNGLVAPQASISTTFTTPGIHTVTAVYSGDANNPASTSPVLSMDVQLAPVFVALAASNWTPQLGGLVTLTALADYTFNPTGTITFMDGGVALKTVPIGVTANPFFGSIPSGWLSSPTYPGASITVSFATLGTHLLTVSYSGDAKNAASTSTVFPLWITSEVITYFHNDIEGTPLAATDAAGKLLWSESYRPYGDPVQTPLDANNNLWFTGKSYDSTMGLTYLGARYYDPLVGRFMGIDPKGFDEKNLQSFNRYTYANNNPNKFIDPDGKAAEFTYADGHVYTAHNMREFLYLARLSMFTSSIKSIKIQGHGADDGSFMNMNVLDGKSKEGFRLVNGKVQLQDANENLIGDLGQLLGKRLTGELIFEGCNTATGDNNISKAASAELPNVSVRGDATFIDFPTAYPATAQATGDSDYAVVRLPFSTKTYKNGVEQ